MKKQIIIIALVMLTNCYSKDNSGLNPTIENHQLGNLSATVYNLNGEEVTIMQYSNGTIQVSAGGLLATLNEEATIEKVIEYLLETYNKNQENFTTEFIYNHPWK